MPVHLTILVAMAAIAQYIFFTWYVGRARGKFGIGAPATSGHPGFERAYRVQMNTLELLAAFLPALLLSTVYWPDAWVAGIGLVFVLGRFLYWRAYVKEPASRGLGFVLSILPAMVLVLMAAAGAIRALSATAGG